MKKNVDLKIPKITQLPSGSYFTQVMIKGIRHTITKDTAEECAAEATAIKYGAKQAQKMGRQKILTLEDAIDAYIDARIGALSPSTIYSYKGYKRNCFQSMMKADVFSTTNEQWQAAIKRESATRSPKYIANVWGLFSAAILESTGTKPRVYLPAKEKKERPFLDPDQIRVFVEALQGETIEIAALLAISSLRRSEIKGLKWENVNLEKDIIFISGAMVYTETGMAHKKQNKTKKSTRVIPIIPPLKVALMAADRTSEYVVPYNGSWIYQRINEICEANGLPQVGVHGLRHSFASLAYHLQIPQKITMEIGGWSDPSTVDRIYTHLAQKDIANRAKDFSNFFLPPAD